jgi:P4 family phage/plasmid primase-like protien
MMEAQNTPKNEPFVCKDCQKGGTFYENHNTCEYHYQNNIRNKGLKRTESDCHCENIGHSWNVTVSDKPVTDEQMENYKAVNDELPKPTLRKLKLNQNNPQKIDIVANEAIDYWHFVTERESGIIYWYNQMIYDSKNAVSIIREFAEESIADCTESNRNEVVNKIKTLTYMGVEEFDNDPNIVTLENGIYNLSTGEIKDHTPTHFSKVLIPCKYAKPAHEHIEDNLEGTLFWSYLNSTCTIDGKLDEVMRTDILEMMACCFVKHQINEISFLLYGKGANGKSVAIEYIENMLGEDNFTKIPLQTLADDKFQVASLDGMLANLFTDIEQNELRHTGIIKAISSGEGVQVRHLYSEPFKMKPYAKLIFSCNRFPKVFNDQSDGFFRRWKIIMFKRKFAIGDPNRDNKLKQKLKDNVEEKNLVFSVLIGISKQLLQNGNFKYSVSEKANLKIWNENSDPLQAFVDNYCIRVGTGWKSKDETYAFYKKIMYEQGETPLKYRQFNREFSEHYEEGHSGDVRKWDNLDFKVPKQESLEEYDL